MLKSIRNFCINIKPIMLKLRDGEELTEADKKHIIQFYVEVCNLQD